MSKAKWLWPLNNSIEEKKGPWPFFFMHMDDVNKMLMAQYTMNQIVRLEMAIPMLSFVKKLIIKI